MLNPPHPGRILRRFIDGLRKENQEGYTLQEVALQLLVTPKTLSFLLNGKQGISSEMALRLAAAFPNTTPFTWLELQERYDIAQARKQSRADEVKPFFIPSDAGQQARA